MQLITKKITDPDKKFWKQFDQLVSKTCEHTPQFNSVWLSNYIKYYFKDDQKPFIISVFQNEELVGCLPMQASKKKGTRFYDVIELNSLGFGPSDFFYIPVVKENSAEIIEIIVNYLFTKCKWDKLALKDIPENSLGIQLFEKNLDEKNFSFNKVSDNGFRYIDTFNKDADDYLEKNFYPNNKDLAKSERRIDRKGFNLKFTYIKENVYSHLLKNIELYVQRRESLGQLNKYETAKLKQFLKNIIEKYEELGKVQLTLLEADGKVWAFQLDWIDNGNRYHWNHAYNEDYKRYSPGKVILKQLLVNSINDPSIKSCNHMRGLSRYKEKFTDQETMLTGIFLENPKSFKMKVTKLISSVLKTLGKK